MLAIDKERPVMSNNIGRKWCGCIGPVVDDAFEAGHFQLSITPFTSTMTIILTRQKKIVVEVMQRQGRYGSLRCFMKFY